jgi:hypothetical protein
VKKIISVRENIISEIAELKSYGADVRRYMAFHSEQYVSMQCHDYAITLNHYLDEKGVDAEVVALYKNMSFPAPEHFVVRTASGYIIDLFPEGFNYELGYSNMTVIKDSEIPEAIGVLSGDDGNLMFDQVLAINKSIVDSIVENNSIYDWLEENPE